jgi:hypothetical protein
VLAFQPIQQVQNTKGKNATDSMLIIDALDILHTVPIDGFFIVSSDSDYTRLASRIREQGKLVYGVGEQKTPESFVNACDRFIYVEIIMGSTKDNVLTEEKFEKLVVYSRAAFYQSIGDTDEWADLGQFGNNLRKIDPSFDSRSYGFSQLSKLLEYLPDVFELKRVKPNNVIHVRMK